MVPVVVFRVGTVVMVAVMFVAAPGLEIPNQFSLGARRTQDEWPAFRK